MAFYDDGKPVGGYGMKSNSDYTIEDIVSNLGGGSGGGGGKLVKVTISLNDEHRYVADKTNKEIYDLYREGALIYFDIDNGTYNPQYFGTDDTGSSNTITTTYDVIMVVRDGTSRYIVNVYYLSGVDKGMGNWGLQAFKLMSEGVGDWYSPYPLQLS